MEEVSESNKPRLSKFSPSRSNETAAISTREGTFNRTTTSIIGNLNNDGVPKGFRYRSTTQQQDRSHDSTTNPNGGGGGDGLLQWGQRKRSRASKTEIRSVTVAAIADDSSSSSGKSLIPSNKLQRRSTNTSMPPPSPLCGGGGRSTNPRNSLGKESSRFVPTRHTDKIMEIIIKQLMNEVKMKDLAIQASEKRLTVLRGEREELQKQLNKTMQIEQKHSASEAESESGLVQEKEQEFVPTIEESSESPEAIMETEDNLPNKGKQVA